MLPGRGDPPEKRLVRGKFITFRVDPLGRLEHLESTRDAVLRLEPVAPAKGAPRELRCHSFVAAVDPATGQMAVVEFDRDVVFEEGTRKGSGQKGRFDAERQSLVLSQNARLEDAGDGSELTAAAIHIHTASGRLAAEMRVRHVTRPRAEGGLGSEGGVATAQAFVYDPETRTCRAGKSPVGCVLP